MKLVKVYGECLARTRKEITFFLDNDLNWQTTQIPDNLPDWLVPGIYFDAKIPGEWVQQKKISSKGWEKFTKCPTNGKSCNQILDELLIMLRKSKK